MSFYVYPSYLEYILVALFFAIYFLYFLLSYYKANRLELSLRFYFWFKLVFRMIYMGLIVIAMLGPVVGNEKQQVKVQGKDIVFAIDISASMDTPDVLPTRLEKVKYEIQLLLNNPIQARIGIVSFASEAFSACPLTRDYLLLQDIFIPAFSTKQMQGQSTQLRSALEVSMRSVLREREDKIHKRAKVIVLFTDGEDFGEDYADVAREIQRKGIHLLVVGVGSEKGSPILTQSGYKKDAKGEQVISKLNRKALVQLALQNEGKYFEISRQNNTDRNDMDKLRANLEEIQGTIEDKREMSLDANKYFYPLLIAFMMIILDNLLTTRIIKLAQKS